MFVVAQKRLFWWPVVVKIPHPETPGEFVESSFEIQFEALALDRAREIDEDRAKLFPKEKQARPFDYIFAIVRNWRDVVDESKAPIPFTRQVLEEQLQFAWFRDAVDAAYQQAITGQQARLGNSDAPRAH